MALEILNPWLFVGEHHCVHDGGKGVDWTDPSTFKSPKNQEESDALNKALAEREVVELTKRIEYHEGRQEHGLAVVDMLRGLSSFMAPKTKKR